ncbi:MAG: extracellular solute-binding protein, partial [Chloroflexi bacterium]
MKQRFIFILVLALALMAVAPALAQDDGLLIWADETRAPILQELGDDFEAEFGVPVTVQEIGLGDARDQLLVAGPVGEGPDIMIIAHDSTGVLVANGAIVPLDLGDLEDEFLPAALNLFTFNNELWGMPYAMENIALIRNVDLVPEAPATWQEVMEISRQLKDSGAADYGFLVQSGDAYH